MAFADSLRLLWMAGILKGVGPRSSSTEKLFNTRLITLNGVNGQEGFNLFISNPSKTVEYFAHEADRFASAAFESLIIAARNEAHPRSIAWLLIQGYYSAFFAMHALLRIRGWACTKLAKKNLDSINAEVKALYPAADSFAQGLYLIKSQSAGRDLICSKLDAGQGGSHETLWALLPDFFDQSSIEILSDQTNPEDAQQVVEAIDTFLRVLKKHGGNLWFTQLRNRVNYSHAYGAWFPYHSSTSDFDRLKAVFDRWRSPPADAFLNLPKDELNQFAASCAFLVSLCRLTVEDLAYRSSARSPFRTSSGRLALP